MHITRKTRYGLQYLTIQPSGYMNALTEPSFLALKHGMEYFMYHPHEPIMYSRKKIHKTEKSPHQCYFKAGYSEIIKNKEYSNFLHTYCDENHAKDISDRRSVTSTVHLFNGTVIDWYAKKQSETSRISANTESTTIYTGVLD